MQQLEQGGNQHEKTGEGNGMQDGENFASSRYACAKTGCTRKKGNDSAIGPAYFVKGGVVIVQETILLLPLPAF